MLPICGKEGPGGKGSGSRKKKKGIGGHVTF